MPLNNQQIRALTRYINSQGMDSPTDYRVAEGIINKNLPAPTADDFRKYALEVDTAKRLDPYRFSIAPDMPISRKKTYGQSKDPDAEINPLYIRKEEEFPEPTYEIHQPTYYTPGFENYVDPWIAWENAWGETYTPQ